MNERQFQGYIDDIYAAAFDPASWKDILRRLSDEFGGGAPAVLSSVDRSFSFADASHVTSRVDPGVMDLWRQHYSAPEANPLLQRGLSAPLNRWVPDVQLITEADMVRTPFYNDIVRPQGAHYSGFAGMPLDRHRAAVLNLGRRAGLEPLDHDHTSVLNALIPHVRRSLQVQSRLDVHQAQRDGAIAVLDHLSLGVVLVNSGGEVVHANRAASQVIDQGDGLGVRNRRLITARRSQMRTLDRLIEHAIATATGSSCADGVDAPGGAIAVQRPSMLRPLVLLVAPLRIETETQLGGRPAAVVFVSDPEAEQESPTEALTRLYGLTPAEARVVGNLLACETLSDVAERLGVSVATVRTHMRRIFEKTGTRRQAQLVELILRGPGAVLGLS